MNPKHHYPALLLCLLAIACSEQKNLHEMHDATVDMKNTTAEMNKRTDTLARTSARLDDKTGQLLDSTIDLKDKTATVIKTSEDIRTTSQELRDTTDELYDSLRQGNALQLRRDAYDSLLKAPTLFKKLSEASKYFMSFEVQVWNHFAQDKTEEKRDLLAQQAAQEFFMEVEELAPRDGSVDPKAQPSPQSALHSRENHIASFNALALSMHQMNRKQVSLLQQNPGMRPISMLSLMEEALLAEQPLNQGADMGTKIGFMREVLAHKPKAIQILQTRYNTFPMVFIDFVSQIGDKNKLSQAMMVAFGWNFTMDNLSAPQIEYLQTEVLSQALEAREFLKKLGVTPKMDPIVARLLKKMRVQTNGNKSPHTTVQMTKLVGLIQELQKGL